MNHRVLSTVYNELLPSTCYSAFIHSLYTRAMNLNLFTSDKISNFSDYELILSLFRRVRGLPTENSTAELDSSQL
jgi:hypothetical protein